MLGSCRCRQPHESVSASAQYSTRSGTQVTICTYVELLVVEELGEQVLLKHRELLVVKMQTATREVGAHFTEQALLELRVRRLIQEQELLVHATSALEEEQEPEEQRDA